MMTEEEKEQIKNLVKQVIGDMTSVCDIATETTTVANVTGNMSGFDSPLGPKIKRKLNDFPDYDEED